MNVAEESATTAHDIAPQADATRGVWGLWPTLGFFVLILGALVLVYTAAYIGFPLYYMIENPDFNVYEFIYETDHSGLVETVISVLCSTVSIGLVILFIRKRKHVSVKDYLALNSVSTNSFIQWHALLLIYIIALHLPNYISGTPLVNDDTFHRYETAYLPISLLLTIIVAPIMEELVFRGFLFVGIQNSKLGDLGAILISSFAWASLHGPLGDPTALSLLLHGFFLGYARAASGSNYVTISCHAIYNAHIILLGYLLS